MTAQPAISRTGGTPSRLAWLDVLRGVAALCVVFDHFGAFMPAGIRGAVNHWSNPGDYGVFVFFLISGYIVPASLERKGSVRTFWVSRIFRLYPLYLLAIGLAVALWMAHFGGLRGEDADPETSVLSQMLMMSNVLAGTNLPNVVWSLSYEMIFYLLLTALFMARVHRRSSRYALGLAAAAVALGGLLPQAYFTDNVASPRVIALVADLVVLTGLALVVVFRGMPRFVGAALAALVGIPAAPGAHRGLRPSALDLASPLVLAAAAHRRVLPGRPDPGVLADLPVRRTAHARHGSPARWLARCPVRSGPPLRPGARPGGHPGPSAPGSRRVAGPLRHAGGMASRSEPGPAAPVSPAPLPPPREPGTPYRVCLVCLGNICRSPMAETVLRATLAEADLDGAVTLDSAGTGDWHVGEPMYQPAQAALAGRGYDGSAHRASLFRPSWLAERDLILAMDARNLATLRRMAGTADRDRIRLFGEIGGLTQAGGEIPDPYGGDAADFRHVLDLLGAAAPVIAARLGRLLDPDRPDTPA